MLSGFWSFAKPGYKYLTTKNERMIVCLLLQNRSTGPNNFVENFDKSFRKAKLFKQQFVKVNM